MAEKSKLPKPKTIDVESARAEMAEVTKAFEAPAITPEVMEATSQPPAVEAQTQVTVVTEKKEPTAPSAPRAPVMMDERGRQGSFDLEQAFRLASALFKGKAFPDWVKSPEQAMGVSLFLKNLGLEVMTGIQHVCMVNGRLSLWGEGPLAAVRASGKMKSFREGLYDADYKEICFKNRNLDAEVAFAFCVTVRADNNEKKETWFSTKDEKTANQGVPAIWKGYKRTMYKRKARGENLKDNFGDVLQGAGIAEYDNESAPDMPTAEQPSLASQMNKQLEGPDGQTIQT